MDLGTAPSHRLMCLRMNESVMNVYVYLLTLDMTMRSQVAALERELKNKPRDELYYFK